jgi:hypothetical protein
MHSAVHPPHMPHLRRAQRRCQRWRQPLAQRGSNAAVRSHALPPARGQHATKPLGTHGSTDALQAPAGRHTARVSCCCCCCCCLPAGCALGWLHRGRHGDSASQTGGAPAAVEAARYRASVPPSLRWQRPRPVGLEAGAATASTTAFSSYDCGSCCACPLRGRCVGMLEAQRPQERARARVDELPAAAMQWVFIHSVTIARAGVDHREALRHVATSAST